MKDVLRTERDGSNTQRTVTTRYYTYYGPLQRHLAKAKTISRYRPSLYARQVGGLRCYYGATPPSGKQQGGGECKRPPGDRSDDVVGCEDVVQLAALLVVRALGPRRRRDTAVMPCAWRADGAEPLDQVGGVVVVGRCGVGTEGSPAAREVRLMRCVCVSGWGVVW